LKMKTLMTILFSIVFVIGAYAQDVDKLSKSELKKLKKEQRKAEQAAEMDRIAELTKYMVTQQQFVLEADYLSDKYGNRVNVSPTINFVMVDSAVATVQFGSAFEAGYNGVGGATLEGRLTKYEYKTIGKKEDAYNVSMNFLSSVGNYDITIMINPGGYADARISGNWSGKLQYHGKLVPLTLSRVYKGRPLY